MWERTYHIVETACLDQETMKYFRFQASPIFILLLTNRPKLICNLITDGRKERWATFQYLTTN